MEYDIGDVDTEWLLTRFAEVDPDVFFLFSPDWSELIFVNDAYERFWGESVERLEAEPSSFLERVHPDDREGIKDRMAALSRGESIENEFRVLPAGERGPEIRHVWTASEPVFDPETGELVAISGFVRDITDRKEYEQKLERSNERLEEFAQFLSHDIRNYLTIAAGHLDIARQEHEDDDHLATVERALDRIDELTDDVLTLADLDSESLETEVVALAELAEACWTSEDLDDEAAELVVEANAPIQVSRQQFRLVFENLFRNAVEHTDTHPEVRVGVLTDGSGIYVEDNGQGIDPEEAEAIFDFGHTSGGTGLGLTLVRQVVRLHGGDISVTNGDTSGARFEIELSDSDAPAALDSDALDASS